MSRPYNQRIRIVGAGQQNNCLRNNCAKCLTIFLTIVFLLVGFIVTMVGNFAKPFWGPEHDHFCDFCRRDRLETERNLRNCRIVGPIFMGLGGILLLYSIYQCRVQRKGNAGQVLHPPSNVPTGTTHSAGQGTTYGYPQPYGQTPAYGPSGYNVPYGTGPIYPPPMQPPFQPQYPPGGYQQPQASNPSDAMVPPPSYETAVGMTTATPSAPPLEKVD